MVDRLDMALVEILVIRIREWLMYPMNAFKKFSTRHTIYVKHLYQPTSGCTAPMMHFSAVMLCHH